MKTQPQVNVKHVLRTRHGLTLKGFSERYSFKYRDVSDVVRGVRQGNFGTGLIIKEKLNELLAPEAIN